MTISNNTYECEICLNVNHVSKLHCSTCGAVPASYSPIGVTASQVSHSFTESQSLSHEACTINYYIPFVIARGADRAEWHRTMRTYLRTVPADYYAS